MEKNINSSIFNLISGIEKHLNAMNIDYQFDWSSSFFIFSLEDYYDIEDELLLKALNLETIVELSKNSILGEKSIIYTIENESIKIICKWGILEKFKIKLFNLF